MIDITNPKSLSKAPQNIAHHGWNLNLDSVQTSHSIEHEARGPTLSANKETFLIRSVVSRLPVDYEISHFMNQLKQWNYVCRFLWSVWVCVGVGSHLNQELLQHTSETRNEANNYRWTTSENTPTSDLTLKSHLDDGLDVVVLEKCQAAVEM